MEIRVQYVGNDGTYVLDGHRVRSAPGNGDGSLRDEYFWDIRTPIAGDRSMKLVLSCGCILGSWADAVSKSSKLAPSIA